MSKREIGGPPGRGGADASRPAEETAEKTILAGSDGTPDVADARTILKTSDTPAQPQAPLPSQPPAPRPQHAAAPTASTGAVAAPRPPTPPPPLAAPPPARAATRAAMPKAGDRVRHYELIRLIGKGGMGSVFLARDTRLGRLVAIKFLHTQNPELVQRFILEARATARCSSENIVIIYEADEYGGRPFMVLEFLKGQTLTKLLGDGKPVPPSRAVELVVPVVRALSVAHAEGIVHRDLKFDNVFVTESGAIKVLDFGIAKLMQGAGVTNVGPAPTSRPEPEPIPEAHTGDTGKVKGEEDSTDLTRHGAIMGTMSYMSPEQWRGTDVDHRTDIWAVGIMLFRMLAGRHPLHGLEGIGLSVTAELDQPMPKLGPMAPDVPAELAKVVDACLEKRKEKRLPDALSLLRALEPFLPGRYNRQLKIDESPYAGLAPFQESDAGRFFGRTHEIAAVVNRVRDQPIMGIIGPSGAGKSSFVRAGVLPALKRSGETWEALVIRPGRNPLAALANALSPVVGTSSTTLEDDLAAHQALVQRLRDEPGYAGAVLRSRARRENRNVLLFVDQFEELYTLEASEAERLAFTAVLSGVADDATSPTRVMLSIRSDFLDRVPEDPRFMADLSQGLFFLTSPGEDGLRDALVQPAEMAGYRFESPEIVDHMLEHLRGTQGALPLLQFAATKLWETRDPAKRQLTLSSYHALGGIAGALASHADSVIGEMASGARDLVRAIFLRLVTPERTRALVSGEELRELSRDPTEIQRLIDQLVQARLLVVQTGAGVATVEIVHESLIHTWPTLRRWLDESSEDSAFLEQLRNAARQWKTKERDHGLLWRGEMVEEARRFQRRFRGELPQTQQDFLEEVFRQQERSARRKRAVTMGGIVFLSLLVAASAVALVVIRNAQQEAVAQAEVATKAESSARAAEAEARTRLVEVQKKEQERAEAARRAEEAREQVKKANEELQGKNVELIDALRRAQVARRRARVAQSGAERSARAARVAREQALKAAKELSEMLQREQERAKRLEAQLGSPVIETLK